MVAIADMEAGRAERIRMVTLAADCGWIQEVVEWAEDHGHPDCVTLLVAYNATPPGGLGIVAAEALSHLCGRLNQQTRRAQKAAGLSSYVVLPVPLAILSEFVDRATANDLRDALARNEYAVLCMNADSEFLISGFSRIEKDG